MNTVVMHNKTSVLPWLLVMLIMCMAFQCCFIQYHQVIMVIVILTDVVICVPVKLTASFYCFKFSLLGTCHLWLFLVFCLWMSLWYSEKYLGCIDLNNINMYVCIRKPNTPV